MQSQNKVKVAIVRFIEDGDVFPFVASSQELLERELTKYLTEVAVDCYGHEKDFEIPEDFQGMCDYLWSRELLEVFHHYTTTYHNQ